MSGKSVKSLVRHLHAFVREVRPTQKEWEYGIDFLTRTGHMCDDKRQEFILLSDALGASMLVDAINHSAPNGATETTVLGPFFVQTAPEKQNGDDISGGIGGAPMLVTGSVSTIDGRQLGGAIVDVWHSDDDGHYDVQQLDKIGDLAMRARFHTDANGRFHFWSIKPAAYPIPHDGPVGEMLEAQGRHPWRPAHVHFMISAPGFEQLITHVFVAGDKYLDFGRRLWRQGCFDPRVRPPPTRRGGGWSRSRRRVFPSELRFRPQGDRTQRSPSVIPRS